MNGVGDLLLQLANVWGAYMPQIALESFMAFLLVSPLLVLRKKIPTAVLQICCFMVLVKAVVPAIPLFESSLPLPNTLARIPDSSAYESWVGEDHLSFLLVSLTPVPPSGRLSSSLPVLQARIRDWQKPPLLLGVAAVGWFVLLSLMVFQIRRNSRLMAEGFLPSPSLQTMAEECADRLGVRKTPLCIFSPECATPFVAGFFTPSVILPLNLRKEPERFRLILFHEFAHISQRDPWLNFVRSLIQVLQWWNPVVWWMNRQIAVLQELRCDQRVLALQVTDKKQYLEMLLQFAGNRAVHSYPVGPASLSNDFKTTRERMRAIIDMPPTPLFRVPFYWGCGIFFFGFVLFSSVGQSTSLQSAVIKKTEAQRVLQKALDRSAAIQSGLVKAEKIFWYSSYSHHNSAKTVTAFEQRFQMNDYGQKAFWHKQVSETGGREKQETLLFDGCELWVLDEKEKMAHLFWEGENDPRLSRVPSVERYGALPSSKDFVLSRAVMMATRTTRDGDEIILRVSDRFQKETEFELSILPQKNYIIAEIKEIRVHDAYESVVGIHTASDIRRVNGIWYPHKLTFQGRTYCGSVRIEHAKLNVDMDSSLFYPEIPASWNIVDHPGANHGT